jgi:hypothetical protein
VSSIAVYSPLQKVIDENKFVTSYKNLTYSGGDMSGINNPVNYKQINSATIGTNINMDEYFGGLNFGNYSNNQYFGDLEGAPFFYIKKDNNQIFDFNDIKNA